MIIGRGVDNSDIARVVRDEYGSMKDFMETSYKDIDKEITNPSQPTTIK
jgi:hypothetical protein